MKLLRSVLSLAGCVVFAAAPALLRAELKWDRLEAAVQLKSWSRSESVRFGFMNTGSTPVRIGQISPGCGCTVAKLDREVVPPGERGEITADFSPHGKVGTVRIPIRVQIDAEPSETTLTLVATIAEGLQLGSRFIYWKSGEARAARVVRVTVADRENVELGGVECSNPAFTVQFTPVGAAESGEYELSVTPPAEGIAYAAIALRTKEGPAHTERLHSVVARTW